jgi:uncharacterized membrane protein
VDVWVLVKFLHVAAVIAVFSIQIASDLYFQRVTRSGSTEAVAKLGAAIRQRGIVEALIFEIAVVLGLLTAIFGGFNLLAPWLLMSYGIIVIVVVFAVTYAARPFTTILDAAEAGDADAMAQAASAPARRLALAVPIVLYGLLVFLMVTKPFA